MSNKRIPYETATAGSKAQVEIEKLLLDFGCSAFGTFQDVRKGNLALQFVYRGQKIQFEASYLGWAEFWLAKNPWTERKKVDEDEWRQRAIAQGRVSAWSVIRDMIKSMLTAVECDVVKSQHAFLPWIVTDDGRTVADRIEAEGMLPAIGGAAMIDKAGQWIVVDIDGTLSDSRHRQHLAPDGPDRKTDEGWRMFHEASEDDKPVEHAIAVVSAMTAVGVKVMFLTARPEWMRERTIRWLRSHVVEDGAELHLLMRPAGNLERASEMKPRLLAEFFGTIEDARRQIVFVLEDSVKNETALIQAGFDLLMVSGYGEPQARKEQQ